MNALEQIAQALKSKGVDVEIDNWNFLNIEYPEVSFVISDQIETDGYLAATMYQGLCSETGTHLREREFTALTPLTMLAAILNEAKEIADNCN